MAAPSSAEERRRLDAIRRLELEDEDTDPALEELVALAARLADAPMAAISLVGDDFQRIAAEHGLNMPRTVPRNAFCTVAVSQDAPLLVRDARQDPRFADSPLVLAAPHIRAYVGLPLSVEGIRVGALCVMDGTPRNLAALHDPLSTLARAVSTLLLGRLNRNALRDRTALLEKVSREIPGVIFQYRQEADGSARFPFVSEAVRRIYGVSPETAQRDTRGTFRAVHPDDRTRLLESIARSAASLSPWRHEFRVVLGDGSTQWREGHSSPERLPDGATVWHGYIHDTTAGKAARLELQRSRQRAELAIEVAGLAIMSWTPGSPAITLDTRADELFSMSRAWRRLTLDGWLGAVHPEDRERVSGHVTAAREPGHHQTLTFRVQDPTTGDVRHVECHLRVVADDSPDGVLAICASRDVTERQEAARLERISDAAEQGTLARTRLLSRLAHELRTPLSAINGLTDLLESDPTIAASPEPAKRIAQIRQAGRHLEALIGDLTSPSPISGVEPTLALTPVNVAASLRRSIAIVSSTAQGGRVRVLAPGPEIVDEWVLAEPRRLDQCLINLLSNAIKYNRDGGSVAIDVRPTDGRLQITIRDTGVGLTPVQMQGMFTPFNRLGAERTRVPGSGLGLSIVKQLSERMGGTVDVSSVPGVGTQFTIALASCPPPGLGAVAEPSDLPGKPAPPATAAEPRLPTSAAPHADGPVKRQAEPAMDPGSGESPRPLDVLYVEDDALNRLVLAGCFEQLPAHRLRLAASVAEGWAELRHALPDLLLLDLNFDDGDGFELLHRLRSLPGGTTLPVVAVSADASPEDAEQALAAGFVDYWCKPLNVQQVVRRIAAVTSGPDARGAADAPAARSVTPDRAKDTRATHTG